MLSASKSTAKPAAHIITASVILWRSSSNAVATGFRATNVTPNWRIIVRSFGRNRNSIRPRFCAAAAVVGWPSATICRAIQAVRDAKARSILAALTITIFILRTCIAMLKLGEETLGYHFFEFSAFSFGASEATIFSKRGSPRSGSHKGSSFRAP
jgi:hypothetical protein